MGFLRSERCKDEKMGISFNRDAPLVPQRKRLIGTQMVAAISNGV